MSLISGLYTKKTVVTKFSNRRVRFPGGGVARHVNLAEVPSKRRKARLKKRLREMGVGTSLFVELDTPKAAQRWFGKCRGLVASLRDATFRVSGPPLIPGEDKPEPHAPPQIEVRKVAEVV